ncbi:hypothetical protein Hanom_Chr12g01073191 [Helianthus anomalus]
MATRTRSHSDDSPSPFVNQNLINHPGKEVCSFNNGDIAALRNRIRQSSVLSTEASDQMFRLMSGSAF